MLSGVGPRDHLSSLGIDVIEDLPVGHNLQDHVSMSALTFLVNESVSVVEPRLAVDPRNFVDYLIRGTGPWTIPGGAEALAFVNTKVQGLGGGSSITRRERPRLERTFARGPNRLANDERRGKSTFVFSSVTQSERPSRKDGECFYERANLFFFLREK